MTFMTSRYEGSMSNAGISFDHYAQPRSQGLRGETVTKTLVKFVLSFQNFGKKIACAVRHNRIQPLLQYGCVALRMRFFPQNFGTVKRILPGSSSPSHREGPGTEVALCIDICPCPAYRLNHWAKHTGTEHNYVI